jgi:hypothetical protein
MTQAWASKLCTTSAAVKWMKAVGPLRMSVLFQSMDLHLSFHIEFVAKPSSLFYKLTYLLHVRFLTIVVVIIFLKASSTLVQSQLCVKKSTNYEALHYQVF